MRALGEIFLLMIGIFCALTAGTVLFFLWLEWIGVVLHWLGLVHR